MTAQAAVSDADNTIRGVTPSGTTINLFDYWTTGNQTDPDNEDQQGILDSGINSGQTLKFKVNTAAEGEYNAWTGSAEPRTNMVQSTLENGYPKLAVGDEESLSYLFDPMVSHDGKVSYANVGGLLHVDNATGYYTYDSAKNFAEFDGDNSRFTLYKTWGVTGNSAAKTNGQFFPFNTGEDVLTERDGSLTQNGTVSTDSKLNHYFGLTMSTTFIQENGGTNNSQAVTYEFKGDDDVWVFIDGVLVGDLGGIHDAASLKIDFSTGSIYINDVYDGTLNDKFVTAKRASTTSWVGNTFADGTYHTLDFFYLERGNVDSNMQLKFNLVTIPETNIKKVDQEGNPVANVTFAVSAKNQNGDTVNVDIQEATTDANGDVVLLDGKGFPVTLSDLYSDGVRSITLKETNTPKGYRSSGNIRLNLIQQDGSTLLLSDDPWTTGAYAMSKVKSTAPSGGITYTAGGQSQSESIADLRDGNGFMFVVIEKKVGNEWRPVYGDPLGGWHVAEDDSFESMKTAAEQTDATFSIASNGSFEADVDNIPGDVRKYAFFTGEEDASYRGRYYYSRASNWDSIDANNTFPIDNSSNFIRQFSATVYVTNILNRIAVQKVDDAGTPVDGAEMGLYADSAVDTSGGTPVLKQDAKPLETATTKTLTKENDSIDLMGAAIFDHLEPGAYWIGEVNPPSSDYEKNAALSKVIVDETGVYADAGTEDDGISVTRGVGRIVRSMIQFAVDDDIDTTLHNITATLQLGKKTGDDWTWNDADDYDPVNLAYSDDGDAVLDYELVESATASDKRFTVETGIPGLKITQDLVNNKTGVDTTDLVGRDLRTLYTGVTIVTIQNNRKGVLDYEKEGGLTIVKTLEGRGIEGGQFSFKVEAKDQASADRAGITSGLVEEIETKDAAEMQGEGTATVELPVLDLGSFTHEDVNGTYTYTISEIVPATPDGIAYDDTAYTVEITTALNGTVLTVTTKVSAVDGEGDNIPEAAKTYVYSSEEGENIEAVLPFTNVYNPTTELGGSTTSSFNAIKTLTGAKIADYNDKFSFKVVYSNSDPETQVSGTDGNPLVGAVADDGTITFGEIKYTRKQMLSDYADGLAEFTPAPAAGKSDVFTYHYTIIENTEGLADLSITPVTKQLNVEVKVTDDGKGNLTAEVVYPQGSNETLKFENAYREAVVELKGTKVYKNDGELGAPNITGKYDFKVEAVTDGAPMPANDSVKNDADGNVNFGTIQFELSDMADAQEGADGTKTKTFTYKVTETGSVPNVTNDPEAAAGKLVNVTVTEKNGVLSADAESFTFTNAYAGTVTVGEGEDSGAIQIKKIVSGANALSEFEFSFTLTSRNLANVVSGLDDQGRTTVKTTDLKGAVGERTLSFGDLVFNAEGTYTFEVVETTQKPATGADGWTYDNTPKTVTVTVDDTDGDGQLDATVDCSDAVIRNTYTNPGGGGGTTPDPDPTPVGPSDPTDSTVSVSKSLTGRDLVAGEFSFKIEPAKDYGDAVSSDALTGTVDASGKVTFEGGFTFKETGDYEFTVSEVLPQDDDPETPGVQHNGVTYDESTFTITAHVTKSGNKLSVTWDAADVKFENAYEPSETAEITFGAKKVLSGRDLVAGEFAFELVDAEGRVVATATNDAAGNIVFAEPVEFTEAGTFTYTIREVAGDAEGVTYDTAEHTAVVTVTDNGDGTLTATVSYDGTGSFPTFENSYKEPEEPSEPDTPDTPDEPGTPDGETPDTGDHTNAALPALLALGGAALISGALVLRARRSR